MALQIEWSKKAILHLDEVLDYWEERNGSRSYSITLFNAIQEALSVLARYPESGQQTENKFIQKKNVKEYYLYYSFDATHLTVIGVSYRGRGPKYQESMIT